MYVQLPKSAINSLSSRNGTMAWFWVQLVLVLKVVKIYDLSENASACDAHPYGKFQFTYIFRLNFQFFVCSKMDVAVQPSFDLLTFMFAIDDAFVSIDGIFS